MTFSQISFEEIAIIITVPLGSTRLVGHTALNLFEIRNENNPFSLVQTGGSKMLHVTLPNS